jgi:hypothetical protein
MLVVCALVSACQTRAFTPPAAGRNVACNLLSSSARCNSCPFLYSSQPAHRVAQPWRTEAQGCPPRKMRGRQDAMCRLSRQPRALTRLMLFGFVTLQVIRCGPRARTIAYRIMLLPFFPYLPPGVIEISAVHRVLPLGRSRPLHFHVSYCSEYFPSPVK